MNNRSFTLIELLVVIAIVGILSGVVLMSSSGAVNSAQDARIKNDVDSLRKVILSYKALYGAAPVEEDVCDIGSDCSQLSSDLSTMDPNISLPTNPLGGYYTYESDDGNDFEIKATLSDRYILSYTPDTGFSELPPVISYVWTARDAAEANGWESLTYGNGLFVAVTYSGTHQVMTSPDGINWTGRTAAENNYWKSVTYGNGLFVAVAESINSGTHQVMTSPDGINWTGRTAAEDSPWQSVTYGNGLFVAVANGINSGTHQVMTSPDGINWTVGDATSLDSWIYVTYDNGLFVAVAGSQFMISNDGNNWTPITTPGSWKSVTYDNGLFVAVGYWGDVMTSPDGINWTGRTAAEANHWCSVTYGNGLFVAVAISGTHRVMTSPDGINWTARDAAENNQWRSVTYANGRFVAVTDYGTHQVMTWEY